MERARAVARAFDLPKNRPPHNYGSLWSSPVADYYTPISDNLRLPRTPGMVGATSVNPPPEVRLRLVTVSCSITVVRSLQDRSLPRKATGRSLRGA